MLSPLFCIKYYLLLMLRRLFKMGQRFQIITNTDGNINVYHCQWLWGLFAIRRLGTAIKNFIKYNKENGYRSFEDYLKGSFYGKPYDMNSFDRYFNDSFYLSIY